MIFIHVHPVCALSSENLSTDLTGVRQSLNMDLHMFSQVSRLAAVIITNCAVISALSFLDQTLNLIVDIFHLELVLFLLVSSKYSSGLEGFLAVLTVVLNTLKMKLYMFNHVAGVVGGVVTHFTHFFPFSFYNQLFYLFINLRHVMRFCFRPPTFNKFFLNLDFLTSSTSEG